MRYIKPELKIAKFDHSDVVRTSDGTLTNATGDSTYTESISYNALQGNEASSVLGYSE